MENLVGNIWIHDTGSGEVSFYERIGRNYRPLRAESEELPDRIPFEARQVILSRMRDAVERLNKRMPKDVRLATLNEALALFPAFASLSTEEQNLFREKISEGLPDTWEETKPVTEGLKRLPTVEEQVDAANKLKAAENDEKSRLETQLMRERAEKQELLDRLAALEAKSNGEQKT